MDKRYQVFVSSTYADLKEERRAIIQTLIEMDCIPAGMELFPAADEEQFEFIKSIIDDCDYYILIIGGRYGSTTPGGLSYTEKEYDYARQIGLKVLSFIHEKPGTIELDKSELDPTLRVRLDAFREKVKTGSIVKLWTDAKDLPGMVAIGLQKTIRVHPAVGWVRADQLANSQVLNELNEVRKRNQELEGQIREMAPVIENLADLGDSLKLGGSYSPGPLEPKRTWSIEVTWGEVFAAVAPYILAEPDDLLMESHFDVAARGLYKTKTGVVGTTGTHWSIRTQDYQTVKVQLIALGLVHVRIGQTNNGDTGLVWSLTPRGRAALFELGTQKKP